MKTAKRDSDLREQVQKRIRWDIRVSNSDILFEVKNGTVVLNGFFDQEYRHEAALQIINSTGGVKKVIDRSQVLHDYRRSDHELNHLIQRQIGKLLLASDEWIKAEVADGVVKIEGEVYRPRLKGFAARIAWAHSGVRDCFNLIEVIDRPRTPRIAKTINRTEYPQKGNLLAAPGGLKCNTQS